MSIVDPVMQGALKGKCDGCVNAGRNCRRCMRYTGKIDRGLSEKTWQRNDYYRTETSVIHARAIKRGLGRGVHDNGFHNYLNNPPTYTRRQRRRLAKIGGEPILPSNHERYVLTKRTVRKMHSKRVKAKAGREMIK